MYLPINVRNSLGSYDTVGERRLGEFEINGIADHLLANGVIVPPCYIGQDVWHITEHYDGRIELSKGKISMLQQKADKSWKIRITVNSSVWDFTPNEIGKRYFLTKAEAEAELVKRSKTNA
jgi:hypothetical protein